MSNIVCPYCGQEFCFNYEDIEELCNEDNRGDWSFKKTKDNYSLVISCAHCKREIYFTNKGENSLKESINQSRKLKKSVNPHLITAYAFKIDNLDQDLEEFPPDDGELLIAIKGAPEELYEISKDFIDLSKEKGANTIAVDLDDSFMIYFIE